MILMTVFVASGWTTARRGDADDEISVLASRGLHTALDSIRADGTKRTHRCRRRPDPDPAGRARVAGPQSAVRCRGARGQVVLARVRRAEPGQLSCVLAPRTPLNAQTSSAQPAGLVELQE